MPPKKGGEPLCHPTQRGKQQEHGKSHEEAAPEHVGNVQSVAAQLGIARGGKKPANRQYRRYACDEEKLDQFRGVAIADEELSNLHEASQRGHRSRHSVEELSRTLACYHGEKPIPCI